MMIVVFIIIIVIIIVIIIFIIIISIIVINVLLMSFSPTLRFFCQNLVACGLKKMMQKWKL